MFGGFLDSGTGKFFPDAGYLPLTGGTLTGSLTMTGGTLTVRADEDVTTVLGRAAIHSSLSDVALFAHYDQRASTVNYAVAATTSGANEFNSASGAAMNFTKGGANRWAIAASGDHLTPASTDTYDVGTSSLRIREIYLEAGGGTGVRLPSGVINANTTPVGNVGAGEDDLITYTLPASSLSANGKGVRITAWGTTANNANAKTIKLYFGSAAIMTNALTQSVAGTWTISAVVLRTGSNAQDAIAKLEETGVGTSDIEYASLTQTDTAAITIKGTGTATADNDVVQKGMLVEFLS